MTNKTAVFGLNPSVGRAQLGISPINRYRSIKSAWSRKPKIAVGSFGPTLGHSSFCGRLVHSKRQAGVDLASGSACASLSLEESLLGCW